ncbi:periplasmic heavy metal sensor, partial [Sandarakinorhabdus sp.]|uniref:periplasmic heavy metal sensor n=1 Tax=Sandarakinorhabdus sp. TaxID=1916663 RepID=UPI0033416B26
RAGMFPSMTEAGRQIMREAMAAGGNRRAERQQMEAVREQMLTLLSADKIDLAAVKRVTDEERALADASRKQRQAAMLAAVQKLSLEDRKAFVADSRAMKARMDARMDGWRGKMHDRMSRRSADAPPAPPTE